MVLLAWKFKRHIVTATIVVAAAIFGLLMVPNVTRAEDGCGLMGYVFGCNTQQKAAEAQGNLQVQTQQLANEAERQAYDAKVAFEQIAAERDAAAAAAQTETERIRIQGEAEQAKVRAQLESDRLNALVTERMNQTNAQAATTMASIQATTAMHLADRQVQIESSRTDMLLLIAVIVAVCGAGWAYYVHNRRHEAETRMKLIALLSPEAQLAARQLEEQGRYIDVSPAGQLLTKLPDTGQIVRVRV